MTRTPRRDRVIVSLAGLAVLQLALLGARLGNEISGSSSWLDTGDSLPALPWGTVSGDGAGWEPHNAPTVLLVFDPGCEHFLAVAPAWAEWLRDVGADWRVLAVSQTPGEAARSFLQSRGWDLELVEAGPAPRRPSAKDPMGRTPWVLVVDEAGLIVAQGVLARPKNLWTYRRPGLQAGKPSSGLGHFGDRSPKRLPANNNENSMLWTCFRPRGSSDE